MMKMMSHFCIALSTVEFSSHYLIIFSPQICEVVSEAIIPIII